MNKIKKLIAFITILVMSIMLIPVNYAKADETAKISISSVSGTVGDKVTVTLTVSASDSIDAAAIPVSYDNSIIKPVSSGNSGVVSFALLDASAYGSTESISMQFEIIAAGTTTLKVAGDAKISVNGERAQVSSSSSGTVTAKAPASYSSDNALKSLQISPGTLSPAFSPETTTYKATVDSDVEELVVSAVANDGAAKVSISGRRMDPGSNTTTITVTAEDGSVRKYVIYTTRPETSQETATEAPSQTEVQQESSSQTQNSEGIVTIDGKKFTISQDYTTHELPDDYDTEEYDYDGSKVIVGKGLKTGLILMYLESDNGNGGFYVYDEKAKTFSPYNTVDQPQITYVVLPITDSLNKPSGYTLTKFTMNGKEVQVLIDSDRQYCLFYGVSSLGEKGWFRYRVSDATIQAYSIDRDDVTGTVNTSAKDTKPVNNKGYIVVISILSILIAAFAAVTGILCSKLSKLKKVFNMASKDGVDLDSYTEKEIDEYDLDDYEENGDYDDLDSSSDEIAYGDDKSGKDDVEELKLFDIDDDK